MKKYYSIGETAAIMKISVQTLRNYTNDELLKPEYIDPNTGYRYFSFKQFHIIDRIKYMRSIGVSIPEIEAILRNGNVECLKGSLEKRKQDLIEEIYERKEQYEDSQWYLDYFNYMDKSQNTDETYIRTFEARYILYVEYMPEDTVEDIETALFKLKYENEDLGFHYRRQFGFLADAEQFSQERFKPCAYFTYLKYKPAVSYPFIKEIPAGKYLCFQGKLYNGEWDTSCFKKHIHEFDRVDWNYVVANEFENSLYEYRNCPYEIQVKLPG